MALPRVRHIPDDNQADVNLKSVFRQGNTFAAKTTTVTATATRIGVPESAKDVELHSNTAAEIVWIGSDDTVAAATGDAFPLVYDRPLRLTMKQGDNNNIYGIVSTGSVDVYVFGVTNE